MDQILSDMNFTHWMWFVALFIFLLLEMILPGVVFLWLGIAAAVTGTLVWLIASITWEWQLILFSAFSVVSILAGRKFIQSKGDIPSDNELLNQRGNALIGRKFTVAIAIKNGKGKVKVGDSMWTATGNDAAEGSYVTVIAVNGTELIVE